MNCRRQNILSVFKLFCLEPTHISAYFQIHNNSTTNGKVSSCIIVGFVVLVARVAWLRRVFRLSFFKSVCGDVERANLMGRKVDSVTSCAQQHTLITLHSGLHRELTSFLEWH